MISMGSNRDEISAGAPTSSPSTNTVSYQLQRLHHWAQNESGKIFWVHDDDRSRRESPVTSVIRTLALRVTSSIFLQVNCGLVDQFTRMSLKPAIPPHLTPRDVPCMVFYVPGPSEWHVQLSRGLHWPPHSLAMSSIPLYSPWH